MLQLPLQERYGGAQSHAADTSVMNTFIITWIRPVTGLAGKSGIGRGIDLMSQIKTNW